MSERPCYVYAIAVLQSGVPCKPVKIGMSYQPMARLRDLQVGSPVPLVIVGMLLTPDRSVARDAERFIHTCHPDQSLHGEWLNISPWYAVSMLGQFVGDKIDERFGAPPRSNPFDGETQL